MTQGPTNDKHDQFGITIKRDIEPKQEDEGFQSTRPEFPVSEDANRLGHTAPPVVDHSAHKPAIEQAKEQAQEKGNDLLAALLAKAAEAAKEMAKRVGFVKPSKSGSKKKSVIEQAPSVAICPVIWGQEHILSDEEFIKETIGSIDYDEYKLGIHSDEMKRLFYANGGQTYLDIGLLYGAAFSMMRSDKIRAIRIRNNPEVELPWKRNQSTYDYDVKVFVAGLPTVEKFLAIAAAEQREVNMLWVEEEIVPPVKEEDDDKEDGE